ncbi:uncharacterized conserved protein [Moesziomyces antarcticus T-34]|uniref:Uncharacterized conserved protein n=1 Tax=Pseudozyma antarctica (strain T-34) TaxID=1151754 RepID=M9M4P8_PSEA3|nr:uncharacterized conserved protein [Moesziomyces antarcticus T-34]
MASLQLATFPPLSSIAMWNKTILVAALTLVALPLPGALAYRVPDNSVLWSQGSTLESAVTNLKGLIMDGIQRSQYEYPVPDKDAVELFFNDVFRQRQRAGTNPHFDITGLQWNMWYNRRARALHQK